MSKIPGFPTPISGEMVSSVVARYLHRSASPFARNLELLGLRHSNPHAVLPMGIKTLSQNVPVGHPWCNNPRRIIEQHSAVPLLLQFSSPEHYETTVDGLSRGTIGNPSAALGLTIKSNLFPRHTAKFCPKCCAMDAQNYGYTAFYSHHQPAFVKYCSEHCTPLMFNCSKCQPIRSLGVRWGMAGRCLCAQPACHEAISANVDSRIEAPLLWLANQAKNLLSENSRAHGNLMAGVTAMLHNNGIRSTSGKTSNAQLHRLLLSKYSIRFLQEVGIGAYTSDEYHLPNMSIRFRTAHTRALTPDVLQVLLIAGLFVDDVRSLSDLTLNSEQIFYDPRKAKPTTNHRTRLTKDELTAVLQRNDFSIHKAGRSFGLCSNKILSDSQHHEIAIPLTKKMVTKIGSEKIESIRNALNTGESKSSILTKYGISKYSLDLIITDQPQLLRSWTLARSSFSRSSTPPATAIEGCKLPQNDKVSLQFLAEKNNRPATRHNQEETPKKHSRRKSKTRIDWGARTLEINTILSALVNDERTKAERPSRLTTTRIKRAVRLLNSRHIPFPYKKLIESGVSNASETLEEFQYRLIKWAVCEYSKLSIPISSNKLRRIAGVPVKQLHACRELVIQLAAELNLGFYASCSLSPIPKNRK
ncbi:TniQ family protein [Pseudomonas savastanoi]|uniref:TniQ domain-containing protein n=1 Tax=Pseudomonas savastanoi pv. nerii TaxID=360921 RepID=A0AB74B9F3_PSESS|nr:TniQ family protein [Pseudomonas savastanoi]KAA3533807.1 hypothetical protein DXU85_26500 [Pseudomonas savastanoi]KPB17996.1 hypothetical protein AC519_2975 [Pseudomonas savastanoi]KPY78812.1 Uncharacterized protein ALO58_01235 [Pseudomonas savastanoi pv. savastanoi]RML68121.1 hypothetical protein ALQ90_200308 [Pseudomonas savastanoi pv. savastanoi]RML84035.1 hypothetical protein ALQ88_01439 [Pseudomonas savastanoi]